jgi:hypothetical protein
MSDTSGMMGAAHRRLIEHRGNRANGDPAFGLHAANAARRNQAADEIHTM